MRQRSRRTLTRAATTGLIVTVAGISTGLATVSANANPAPPGFSAHSSASLIHLTALNNGLLSVANGDALADIKIATSDTEVDSGSLPHTEAAASHLEAAVLGRSIPTPPEMASRQIASPDHPEARVISAHPVDLGLARIGAGKLRASARWTGAMARPTVPATLAEAAGAVADLTVVPGSGLPIGVPFVGTSVANLPNTAFSQCRASVVGVPGQHSLGVASTARTSAAQLTLFGGTQQQLTVKVISPPTLQVVAAGTMRSSVEYRAPIVEILDAHGNVHRVDAPDRVVEIPLTTAPALPGLRGVAPLPLDHGAGLPVGGGALPALPALGGLPSATDLLPGRGSVAPEVGTERTDRPALLRLSLGHVDKHVTSTSVTAKAATIRLEVLDLQRSGTLLDLAIGELQASASAPPGGLVRPGSGPGEESGSGDDIGPIGSGDPANPGAIGDPGAPSEVSAPGDPSGNGGTGGGNGGGAPSLPVTGAALTIVLAAGVALVLLGRFAMLLAKRRSSATR